MESKKRSSTPAQTRTVSFNVYTGSVDPFKVFVHIYDNKETITSYCRPLPYNNLYKSVVRDLPNRDVSYAYEIHQLNTLNTDTTEDFLKSNSDVVSQTTPWTETKKRDLRTGIDECRDILNFSNTHLTLCPEERVQGLIFHLENIFAAGFAGFHFKDVLKTKLNDIEHLINNDANLDILRSSKIFHDWLLDKFQLFGTDYSQNLKVVLLSCLYGHIPCRPKECIGLANYVIENILKSLKETDKTCLSEWALDGIKVTCHFLLREDGKYHWLYFATHFHNIFALEEILDLSRSLKVVGEVTVHGLPRKTDVEDHLLSRIENIYSPESYELIFEAVVKEFGLSEQDNTDLSLVSAYGMQEDLSGSNTAMLQIPLYALHEDHTNVCWFHRFHQPSPVPNEASSARAKQKVMVSFRVLVLSGQKAPTVTVSLLRKDHMTQYKPMDTQFVRQSSRSEKQQWWFAKTDIELTKDESYAYFYSITNKKKEVKEKQKRRVDFTRNSYDVFMYPDKAPYKPDKTTAEGLLLYVEMLNSCITNQNFQAIFREMVTIGFPTKSTNPNDFIGWFQRSLAAWNTSQVICMTLLLGKLIDLGHHVPAMGNNENQYIAGTIRRHCQPEQFPHDMIMNLHSACVWLIKGIDQGNWLHLWSYFLNFMASETLLSYHKEVQKPVFKSLNTHSESLLTMILDREVINGSESLLKCVPLVSEIIETVSSIESFKCIIGVVSKDSYKSLFDDTTVSDTIVNKLKQLLKGKPLKRLVETWKHFSAINVTTLKEVIRRIVLQRICDDKWATLGMLGDIENLILTRALYRTSNDLKMVSAKMFKEDDVDVLDIFIKVLACDDILQLINDYDLKEIVSNGIKFATSFFQKKKTKAYRIIYTILAMVELRNDTPVKYVDDEVYDSIKNVPICDMLKSISSMSKETGTTLTECEICIMNRMTNHIKKILRDTKSTVSQQVKHLRILHDEAQERDHLEVNSKYILEIVMCMIDIQKPSLNANELPDPGIMSSEFESAILGIVKDAEFWLMILNVSGNYKTEVLQSEVIDNLRCLCMHLVKQVSNKCVTLGFLSSLETHDKITTELVDVLKGAHTIPTWKEQMKKLRQCVLQFRRNLEQLNQFSGVLVGNLKLVVDVKDRSILEYEINVRRDPDKQQKIIIYDTTTPEYWGVLYTVLSLISDTRPICSLFISKIFLNVCRSLFEGSCPSLSLEKCRVAASFQDIPDIDSTKNRLQIRLPSTESSINFTQLATYLSNSCLPVFRIYSDLVLLQDDLDVPLHVVDNLMAGITTEEIIQEMQRVETFFSSGKTQVFIPDNIQSAIMDYVKLPDLKEKSCMLAAMCVAFGVSEVDDLYEASMTTRQSLSCQDEALKSPTLSSINEALQAIGRVDKKLEDMDWHVVNELGKSEDLISFLRPLVNENIGYLVDSIDQRSEQYVNVTIISDLLAVQRYLDPFIRSESRNGHALLDTILANRGTAVNEKVHVKLSNCVHNFYSIAHFYNNIANRAETTKEIILEALRRGQYKFHIDGKSTQCLVTLSYPCQKEDAEESQNTKEKKTTLAKYGLDDLKDLRSRASFLVNKQIPGVRVLNLQTEPTSKHLQEFIEAVTVVNDIIDVRNMLLENPWFIDNCCDMEIQSLQHLEHICNMWQLSYDTWVRKLAEARRRYHYLTFFQSKQLKLLDDFFNGNCEVTDDLNLLFRFVHSDMVVHKNQCRDKPIPEDASLDVRLSQLGIALEQSFCNLGTVHKRRKTCAWKLCSAKLETPLRPGSVYVVELDKESTRSIPVLLSLYQDTCDALPEPNEVVFCHDETSWEEIDLLLQRCTLAADNSGTKHLYTIVNVESLQTDIQFQLVTAIKRLQDGEDKKFMLALICRGGRYHHMIDQFSPGKIHRVGGLSDNDMKVCFQKGWPNVEVVTSSQPGLGKSEYIADVASEHECSVVWLHASGSVTKLELIKQLKSNMKSSQHILHIDVAAMSNPSVFDSFVFEVVVMGISCSQTDMCSAPTLRILIEVANTQLDKLINSLTTCCAFRRRHLIWPARFSSFIVSREVSSHVQVVCRYLKALENGTINEQLMVGDGKAAPLSVGECRQLMDKYITLWKEMSFTVVHNFLEICAMALRSMTNSTYYSMSNLERMIGDGYDTVRVDLVKTILESTAEFSARSLNFKSPKTISLVKLHSTSKVTANEMVARMDGMVKWSDTNHLLPVFNSQDSQTVTLVYRLLKHVPTQIKKLFESQLQEPLGNYQTKTQDELQVILERICRSTKCSFDKEELRKLATNYALTPDNFLKMVLIYLRIINHIPVIIMGETGCGKTTLITYLARVCEVELEVLSIHAGVSKDQIESFVHCVILQAEQNLQKDIWGFLDEINTCDHLGLLNEILCHRRFQGKCLPPNLMFCAACNPYRLQVEASSVIEDTEKQFQNITSYVSEDRIGLQKPTFKNKDSAKLVYHVKQLPESMMDYVWDYGSLSKKDELRYIKRMIGFPDFPSCRFVHLLALSQEFVRQSDEGRCIQRVYAHFKDKDSWYVKFCAMKNIPSSSEAFGHSVSLRDVNRCKELQTWFTKMLEKKNVIKIKGGDHLNDLEIRSMVLALGHCYHSRLTTEEERMEYRRRVAMVISSHNSWKLEVTENDIKHMIYSEQMDILDRLTPLGFNRSITKQTTSIIAKNEALRENVFVILVSMLNRIPVFVVGKPGCSKSLSMQLIESGLRGPLSIDSYFKQLPRLCKFSFQGSESSTSEGIIKIFDMAKDYKHKNPADLPYVLLDEIGLAEISASNPLKVLHSQLEPTVGEYPPVAVVGISNYELDASKRNRAVQLSRPEPSVEDLALTAKIIRKESARTTTDHPQTVLTDEKLDRLANAYKRYQHEQTHRDFHGLRDYYFLVKYISVRAITLDCDLGMTIERGLLRNFGGLTLEMNAMMNKFSEEIDFVQQPLLRPSLLELIEENVTDKHSRHLLLISHGDSALNILSHFMWTSDITPGLATAHNLGMKPSAEPRDSDDADTRHLEIILGSRFENDISEEYNYRIINQIILCMERNVLLVLKDLESLYGSLYDMLNQNYTTIGTGDTEIRTCRVALGSYSNPVCYVHDNFRCIVLVDDDKLDKQDPPFLNRFEKQTLRYTDLMEDNQRECINSLNQWMNSFCCSQGSIFSPGTMFLGFHSESLTSLVFQHNSGNNEDFLESKNLLTLCKTDLLKIACPDAVLRLRKSLLAEKDLDEVKLIEQQYFRLHIHDGLRAFMTSRIKQEMTGESTLHQYSNTIIYTHSSIYIDITKCIGDSFKVQVSKMNRIKSERMLSSKIKEFWCNSDAEILFIQCLPELDGQNMMLVKYTVEQVQSQVLQKDTEVRKHVCIVVHLDRATDGVEDSPVARNTHGYFNFQKGWQQYTIDSLENKTPSLSNLIYGPSREASGNFCLLSDILEPVRPIVNIESIVHDQAMWCFSCIKYSEFKRNADSFPELLKLINGSDNLKQCFQLQILKYIRSHDHIITEGGDSWQVIAACDTGLMFRCSTLIDAMQEYIKCMVRIPLAKIIFFLEKSCAWPNDVHEEAYDVFWRRCFDSENVFDILSKELPDPRGAETYEIGTRLMYLKFPFFTIFYHKIETFCEWLLQDVPVYDSEHQVDVITLDKYARQVTEYVASLSELQYDQFLLKIHIKDYSFDFCAFVSVNYLPTVSDSERYKIMSVLLNQFDITLATDLHAIEYISRLHIVMHLFKVQLISILKLLALQPESETQSIGTLLVRCLSSDAREYTRKKDTQEDPAGSLIGEEITATEGRPIEGETTEDTSYTFQKDHTGYQTCDGFLEAKGKEEDASVLEDNDAVSVEQIDFDEMSTSFQINLVNEICISLLPRKCVLEKFEGLDGWLSKVTSVLLLSGYVNHESSSLHSLRLCRDFTTVGIRYNVSMDQVAKLAEYTDCDDINTERVIQFIKDHVSSYINGEEDPEQVTILHEFLCRYFNLCLQENLDTPLLPRIIDTLTTDSGTLLAGSHSVLHTLIASEIQDDVGLCKTLILTADFDVHTFPNFGILDSILRESRMDCSLAVACSDIIEDTAFFDINSRALQQIQMEDDDHLKLATESSRLVNKPNTTCSLQFVCAVAFLRKFLRAFGDLVRRSDPGQFKAGYRYSILGSAISGIFQSDSSCLKLVFLRGIRQHVDLVELRKLGEQLAGTAIPFHELLWHENLQSSRLGCNPMSVVKHYVEAKNIIVEWQNSSSNCSTALNELVTKAEKDPDYRLAFLASIAESFYWTRTNVTWISDSDNRKARELMECTTDFNPYFNHLLERFLGISDFGDPLKISNESSVDKLQRVSVLVHIACLAAAYNDLTHGSLLQLILSDTGRVKHFLPGVGSTTLALSRFQLKSCSKTHPKTTSSTERIRAMSPAAYRVLNVITHGCLLVGMACNFTSDSNVTSALATLGLSDVKDDIGIQLNKRVKENWLLLQEMIYSNAENVTLCLHMIIDDVSAILVGDQPLQTETDRDKLEEVLSEKIQRLVKANPDYQRMYKVECLRAQGVSIDSLEGRLEELDSAEGNLNSRMFRMRRLPTFDDLRARFIFDNHGRSCHYPFLQLCIGYHESLSLLHNLPIFLEWNNLITNRLSQHIKRHEGQIIIGNFLDKDYLHADKSSQTSAKRLFKRFQDAWNNSIHDARRLLNPEIEFAIITNDTPLVVCILEKTSLPCSLQQMISSLQHLQNDFLTKAMEIAQSARYSNLSFMVGDSTESGLKEVSLSKAKSEIIQYHGTQNVLDFSYIDVDKMYQFSNFDTRYGYGSCISYNLTVIERELARVLIMNKAILLDGTTFTKFTYTDELFHACSAILIDIHEIVPQKHNLGKEILNALQKEHDECGTFATQLLQQLEVILVLLKKTGGNPEDSLDDYIERWSTKLPGSFPKCLFKASHEHTIQLQHIVDLYKHLEQLMMNSVIVTLDKSFRENIPTTIENSLSQELTHLNLTNLEMISDMIHRFVFRFVRPINATDSNILETNLVDLMRRSVSDPAERSALKMLSRLAGREINLCHVAHLASIISTKAQQLQDCDAKKHRRTVPTKRRPNQSHRRVAGGGMAIS